MFSVDILYCSVLQINCLFFLLDMYVLHSLAVLCVWSMVPSPITGDNRYKQGDTVMLYVNKVGPYHNPQETYHYYQLPVCAPTQIRHKSLTLGEVLDGDRMAESMYKITYRVNMEREPLCELKLSVGQVRHDICPSVMHLVLVKGLDRFHSLLSPYKALFVGRL